MNAAARDYAAFAATRRRQRGALGAALEWAGILAILATFALVWIATP